MSEQNEAQGPVVLIGNNFRSTLLDRMREHQIKQGHFISAMDLDGLHVTDDVDEAVAIIAEQHEARIAKGKDSGLWDVAAPATYRGRTSHEPEA